MILIKFNYQPYSLSKTPRLGGGFKYFLFSPLFGEKILILTNIFRRGWFNHQPVIPGQQHQDLLFFLPNTFLLSRWLSRSPVLTVDRGDFWKPKNPEIFSFPLIGLDKKLRGKILVRKRG